MGNDKNVDRVKDQNRQTVRRRNAVENKQDEDDATVKAVTEQYKDKKQ